MSLYRFVALAAGSRLTPLQVAVGAFNLTMVMLALAGHPIHPSALFALLEGN